MIFRSPIPLKFSSAVAWIGLEEKTFFSRYQGPVDFSKQLHVYVYVRISVRVSVCYKYLPFVIAYMYSLYYAIASLFRYVVKFTFLRTYAYLIK